MSRSESHYISGQWHAGEGLAIVSTDPATGEITWEGRAATKAEVDRAVCAAREALRTWGAAPLATRIALVQAVAAQYRQRRTDLAEAICRETGKPRWEALTEVDAMVAKVAISLDAYNRRNQPTESTTSGITSAVRFKPIGAVAVLGPFNFPGHLPNGHLIPAVLAGNTVVFKPSEQAPLVGATMAEAWQEATESCGAPAGTFGLIQGAAQTGQDLAVHLDLDGLYFTGSYTVGRALNRLLAEHPGKMLALEMGGNNPLIVHECADLNAASLLTIQSAYLTAGQRCSCARRLIVPRTSLGDAFIDRLIKMMARVRYGFWSDEPEPFHGTVISAAAADLLLEAQARLVQSGGAILVEMKRSPRSTALLSPGLIDVTGARGREDRELFGPILQVIRVADFDAALLEANDTRFGLTAGLISDRRELYERIYSTINAGVVNWNCPLTGASSNLPFGGVGCSGNHRPSAYYAADYCACPVASLESKQLVMPASIPKGLEIEP